MLRAHIEHHLLGVEESFLCVCYRLFLHNHWFLVSSFWFRYGANHSNQKLETSNQKPSPYLRSAYFTSIKLVS
jgi:hypothetical protein